jgi:hypothetical protein
MKALIVNSIKFVIGMPKVLYLKGYEFFFYSNEGNEPMHIHVCKAEAIGKIWLEPDIGISYMYGFSSKEKKEILIIVHDQLKSLKDYWNEYFKK